MDKLKNIILLISIVYSTCMIGQEKIKVTWVGDQGFEGVKESKIYKNNKELNKLTKGMKEVSSEMITFLSFQLANMDKKDSCALSFIYEYDVNSNRIVNINFVSDPFEAYVVMRDLSLFSMWHKRFRFNRNDFKNLKTVSYQIIFPYSSIGK